MVELNAGERTLRTAIVGVGVATFAVLTFGIVSVEVNPWLAGVAVSVIAVVAYGIADDDDEVSISFAFTLAIVGVFVLKMVVPQSLTGMLPVMPYLQGIDAQQFAVLGLAIVGIYWVIDERFISPGKRTPTPETVAENFSDRVQNLVKQWLSIARVMFILGIMIGVLLLNTFIAPIIGELGTLAAESPYIVADVVTLGLGYLALGGDVPLFNDIPFLSEIGSQGFLLLGLLALGLAVGVDYSD